MTKPAGAEWNYEFPPLISTGQRPGEATIKKLIWLYFWLLLFEGGLRKWVLPGLATPLLIIRDPVALGALVLYVSNGYRIWNWYTLLLVCTSLISLVLTMGYGHGNLGVALFGFRIYALHYVMIFIIGDVFDRSDVERMGEMLLYVVVPTTLLVALQFYSPQSAWVNRGVGGDMGGAGFSGALGYSRPPGLFSFTNGNSSMYGLATVFLFYFWRHRPQMSRFMLLAATAGVLIVIPLSISRTYLFQFSIAAVFFAVASSTDAASLFRALGLLLSAPVLLLILSQFGFVSTGLDALLQRFSDASVAEGGFEGTFFDRFLGGFINPFLAKDLEGIPLWGLGLGMGTNVGSSLLTGKVSYLIAEGEWGRVVGESGPVIGAINLAVRLQLAVVLLFASFRKLFGSGNALAWMLISFSFLGIFNALSGQPTALGFAVLSAGLTIAALNDPEIENVR